jgi:uncharacterized membrane protein SpoIIM required for sporulation
MRETKFIEQHKADWEHFESLLSNDNVTADELNEMYLQVSDNLSYARTFYPNRSIRIFLNQLALNIRSKLFNTKRSQWSKFIHFWKTELPLLVYESRREFLIAFLVFLLAALVGALSTAIDSEFPRLILGEHYVNMTLNNIQKGDPMAVYKGGWAVSDSLGITANNIFVSFLTFFLGILGSIGTVLMLLRNGIMVGAFQYFFIQKGVFWQSFLAIWLHGTLEISAIIIAGAAGITMGKGLLFPGSFRRVQAFQRSARRGFKIMVGIVPVLIIAGTVEGFFTRYTDAPTYMRLGFIILSLAFIVFYFMWLPYFNYKNKKQAMMTDRPLPPDNNNPTDWYKIRSVSVVFADTFFLFSKHLTRFISWSIILTLFYAIMCFLFSEGYPLNYFSDFNTLKDTFLSIFVFPVWIYKYFALLKVSELPLLMGMHILAFSLLGSLVFLTVSNQAFDFRLIAQKTIILIIPVAILQFLIYLDFTIINIVLCLTLNFWFIFMWDMLTLKGLNLLASVKNSLRLVLSYYGLSFFSNLLLLIGGATIYILINFFDSIIWEFIVLHLTIEQQMLEQLRVLFNCSIGFLSLCFTFTLMLIGSGFTYYTLYEIGSAEALLEQIRNITVQRKLRGLVRE